MSFNTKKFIVTASYNDLLVRVVSLCLLIPLENTFRSFKCQALRTSIEFRIISTRMHFFSLYVHHI